jgi:hypothetical protein
VRGSGPWPSEADQGLRWGRPGRLRCLLTQRVRGSGRKPATSLTRLNGDWGETARPRGEEADGLRQGRHRLGVNSNFQVPCSENCDRIGSTLVVATPLAGERDDSSGELI